jgi:hypothetical protein
MCEGERESTGEWVREREEYECVREGVSRGKREKGVCEKESERDCA